MYTNSRTGKSVYYRAVGGTDDAVIAAVNNKVAYRKWHGASPALYNIYGTMASIVPLLGESHTFQGVAIVKIDNMQTVATGDDLPSALHDYAKLTGYQVAEPPPTDFKKPPNDYKISQSRDHVKVDRIGSVVKGGETIFYLHITGSFKPQAETKVFTAPSTQSPKLALTKPGDTVSITYNDIETSGDVVLMPMYDFDNQSIPLTLPATPAPKTAK